MDRTSYGALLFLFVVAMFPMAAYQDFSENMLADEIAVSQPLAATVFLVVEREAPSSGIVLDLDFEGDWNTSGVVADKSGNANNAICQKSFSPNNNPAEGVITANQCPASIADAPKGNKAASFSGAKCLLTSDYLAVPSKASLKNLTQGSIALWINYNPTTDPMFSVPRNEYTFQYVLDTTTMNTPNTWLLGRNYGKTTSLAVINASNQEQTLVRFPDSDVSGAWNHYVVTWDGTTAKGYYNGSLFVSNPYSNITGLDLSHYLAIGTLKHNFMNNTKTGNCEQYYADAVAYHGYGSDQKFVFPNAGFFNGKLDDVKIYNKVLTGTEVTGLYGSYVAQSQNTDSDNDGVVNSSDYCPSTPSTLRSTVNGYGCPKPKIVTFDIKPNLETDLTAHSAVEVGKSSLGKIRFNQSLNLVSLDFDSNISILKNKITVNSINAPELNKPATITLYNVTEKNPKIMKDGAVCTQCQIVSFTNGTLIFTVPGF